jgi:hypothetical protein
VANMISHGVFMEAVTRLGRVIREMDDATSKYGPNKELDEIRRDAFKTLIDVQLRTFRR